MKRGPGPANGPGPFPIHDRTGGHVKDTLKFIGMSWVWWMVNFAAGFACAGIIVELRSLFKYGHLMFF